MRSCDHDLTTHQYDSAHSADDITSEIQITIVQYTSCRLTNSSKMAENIQGFDKKNTYFNGKHCL